MKTSTLFAIIMFALIAFTTLWGVKCYNQFVTAEENVETAWSHVESQYQRRSDLIPNLVNTVKGYAAHEQTTLEQVIAARAQATAIKLDAAQMTADQIQAFNDAQGQLSMALGRLMAVSEAYPDLKANQNFLELQAQLEGTENRITVARNTFNEQAKAYNVLVRRFPKNIIAQMFGFEKKPYFEAEEGAEKAPTVEF